MVNNTFLLLGNQLFDPQILKDRGCKRVFMAEDYGLCTYEKHHKLKIYLYLCAMREYKEELERNGIQVDYFSLEARSDDKTYIEFLVEFLHEKRIDRVDIFEIENKSFEKNILAALEKAEIKYELLETPLFLFSRKEFDSLYGKNKSFRLGNFYKVGRKKFNILVDGDESPLVIVGHLMKKIGKKFRLKRTSLNYPNLIYQSTMTRLQLSLKNTFWSIQEILKMFGFP